MWLGQLFAKTRSAVSAGSAETLERVRSKGPLLISAGILLSLVFGAFLSVLIANVFTKVPCCADDAYYSLVAKHLLLTGRYAFQVSSEVDMPFDAGMGSGPTLILPGTLAIWAFGPRPWATAISSIVIFALLLSLTARQLATRFGAERSMLFLTLAIVSMVSVTAHHDYYSKYLGEVPAFGFIALGAATLVRREPSKRSITLAGICFGLALLAKFLALFSILGICGIWLLTCFQRERKRAFPSIMYLGFGFLLPILPFEAIKLMGLGWSGYLQHWRDFLFWSSYNHTPGVVGLVRPVQVLRESYLMSQGSALLIVLIILLAISSRFLPSVRREDSLFALMLFAGVFVNLLYVLLYPPRFTRYLWIGVVLCSFAVVTPVLFARRSVAFGAVVGFFLLFATPGRFEAATSTQLGGLDGRLVREQARVLEVLESYEHLPLVSESWGSFFDIVYLLPEDRKWYAAYDPRGLSPLNSPETKVGDFVEDLNALVVMNKNFVLPTSPFAAEIQSHCSRIQPSLITYSIYLCAQD